MIVGKRWLICAVLTGLYLLSAGWVNNTQATEAAETKAAVCVATDIGQTCVDRPVRSIVALDQQSAEALLALGIQPVGMANPSQYRKFTGDAEPRLADAVVDIGLSTTPNIELILALQPELIIGSSYSVQKSLALLQAIAPIAAFRAYPGGDANQLAYLSSTLTALATLTGQHGEAERFLNGFDQDLATARARFHDAGLSGRSVILGNVNSGVTGADVMIFNANALPAIILTECGFRYAMNEADHRERGFIVTTAESLISYQHADFLYLPFNRKGVEHLMSTPIWRNLAFVREDRVREIPYRLIHNGPLSARLFLRDLQAALLP